MTTRKCLLVGKPSDPTKSKICFPTLDGLHTAISDAITRWQEAN